jgi:hypothetical protein
MKKKEKIIKSVGDFINELAKQKPLNRAFYRGESKKFDTPLTAFGLRHYRQSNRLKYNSFYREVHSRLTVNEREHFIAFCQHHGIPTNLLDVTSHPLIALYFACCDHNNDDGYVYLFSTIDFDVTTFIDGLRLEDEYENRINYLCRDKKHRDFICEMLWEIKCPNKMTEDIIKELIIEIKNDKYEFDIQNAVLEKIIHILPLSLYSPLLTFDRAVSQQSSFIFQWNSLDNKQTIFPDFLYKIPCEDKLSIIDELDMLKVNRATVFQDFDNIAEYIKEKQE